MELYNARGDAFDKCKCLPELGNIDTKKISALVGVAPYTRESGQYKGVSRIYDGRLIPRNALYMASLSAIRYNPIIKRFFESLVAKGKKRKIALIACMHKMIIILNSIIKNKTMWTYE